MFVPNFKILIQVVSEKYLTEKKFTDRQTNKHPYGKGKNYIPPIYFVYRGYNQATQKQLVGYDLTNEVLLGYRSRNLLVLKNTVGRTGTVVSVADYGPRGPWFETWPQHSLLWP